MTINRDSCHDYHDLLFSYDRDTKHFTVIRHLSRTPLFPAGNSDI